MDEMRGAVEYGGNSSRPAQGALCEANRYTLLMGNCLCQVLPVGSRSFIERGGNIFVDILLYHPVLPFSPVKLSIISLSLLVRTLTSRDLSPSDLGTSGLHVCWASSLKTDGKISNFVDRGERIRAEKA